jgi:DNA (cytosine-5)-methyltransferase 1
MTYKMAGLFAGIGGIELGLADAGFATELLCEIEPAAKAVLSKHFSDVPLEPDVTKLKSLPSVDLVSAGFPCQDLSQAGGKQGIKGQKSSLVESLFKLVRKAGPAAPEWLVIENVSYMLRLDRGKAMDYLTSELEALGYAWAYRVVDARSFGVPQRRHRVLMVASRNNLPEAVLFADDAEEPESLDVIGPVDDSWQYGFYWTEGRRGLGWADNAVPPIKGGSGLGIPSPPAVWTPKYDDFGTPHLRDAERLQGFDAGWTNVEVAGKKVRDGARWQLVGNAVCVAMSRWLGDRLANPGEITVEMTERSSDERWPKAAMGRDGRVFKAHASTRPLKGSHEPLETFLREDLDPLSVRAASGFLSRAGEGRIRFPDGFLDSLRTYIGELEALEEGAA